MPRYDKLNQTLGSPYQKEKEEKGYLTDRDIERNKKDNEWDKFGPKSESGMLSRGNIDLTQRPKVKNEDGTISTVRSIGVNIDGKEVLIPTVSDDGRILSDDEAVEQYRKTGKHLGMFDNPQSASDYAERLHQQQAQTITPNNPSNERSSLLWDQGRVEKLKEQEIDPAALARGLAQGGTLGYADELAGVYDALVGLQTTPTRPFEESYRTGREESREAFREAQERAPGSYMTGDVLGSLGTLAIPGVGAARSAKALAGLGGLAGGGRSEADLTEGEVGEFGRDVTTGAALGAGIGKAAERFPTLQRQLTGKQTIPPKKTNIEDIRSILGRETERRRLAKEAENFEELPRLTREEIQELSPEIARFKETGETGKQLRKLEKDIPKTAPEKPTGQVTIDEPTLILDKTDDLLQSPIKSLSKEEAGLLNPEIRRYQESGELGPVLRKLFGEEADETTQLLDAG